MTDQRSAWFDWIVDHVLGLVAYLLALTGYLLHRLKNLLKGDD